MVRAREHTRTMTPVNGTIPEAHACLWPCFDYRWVFFWYRLLAHPRIHRL